MNTQRIYRLNSALIRPTVILLGFIIFSIFNTSSANANIDSIIQELYLDKSNDELLNLIETNPNKKRASTSGLNSEKQKQELTQTIANIYSEEWIPNTFWNGFEDKRKVQNALEINDDSYECIIQNHNYNTFDNMIFESVNDYVDSNNPEDVHNDLVVLIDSGLANEYHDLFKNIFEKGEIAKSLFKLHLMQDPYLSMGAQLQSSNEKLSNLIGMGKSDSTEQPTYILGRYIYQVMTNCGVNKTN